MTPNQVVAYNLRRGRELRGWTQDEATKQLEPWLGARWSKAIMSAAERSADRGRERIRQFTADDLVVFARAFQLPLAWFLIPPADATTIDTDGAQLPPGELVDLLFMGGVGDDAETLGTEDRQLALLADRLGELFGHPDAPGTLPRQRWSAAQRHLRELAGMRAAALVSEEARELLDRLDEFRGALEQVVRDAEPRITGEASERGGR